MKYLYWKSASWYCSQVSDGQQCYSSLSHTLHLKFIYEAIDIFAQNLQIVQLDAQNTAQKISDELLLQLLKNMHLNFRYKL